MNYTKTLRGLFLLITFALLPQSARAQSVTELLDSAIGWVNTLILLAATLGLLFFFWGMAKYILAGGNKEGKDEGKNVMLRGIVGLFVIASVWGIVALIGRSLGIGQGGSFIPPLIDPKSYNTSGTSGDSLACTITDIDTGEECDCAIADILQNKCP